MTTIVMQLTLEVLADIFTLQWYSLPQATTTIHQAKLVFYLY